jgi:putative transposase
VALDAPKEPGRTGPAPYELSEADREAFAYFHGNIAAVQRARAAVVAGAGTAAGLPVPEFLVAGWAGARQVSDRTLERAFAAGMTPAELAMWREGEEGYRAAGVYLKRPEEHRGAVWEMDHKNLPILVLPPRGPAVTPWLTTIIDDGTRGLVGWAISITPHSGTVLTAIRMALVHDPQRGPFGAVPAAYRIDRGLDFAAIAVDDVMAALVAKPHRLPGFTPHRKGKVERLHLTIDETLLKGLPGFTEGPREASGKLFGPLSDRSADRAAAQDAAVRPMRIERFAATFADWVRWYNHERGHSMIGGRPPAQAWAEDPSALMRIDAERVRHLLLAGTERVIGKDGIRFNSLSYAAPELHGRGGQRVHVRYMPHDDRSIEVYLDGTHLCTAVPSDRMTEAQTEAFREHARAETKRLGAEKRRAARRARSVLAPLTGEQLVAEESRVLPARKARPIGPSDATLRAKARSDLLGLHPTRAIPPKPEP